MELRRRRIKVFFSSYEARCPISSLVISTRFGSIPSFSIFFSSIGNSLGILCIATNNSTVGTIQSIMILNAHHGKPLTVEGGYKKLLSLSNGGDSPSVNGVHIEIEKNIRNTHQGFAMGSLVPSMDFQINCHVHCMVCTGNY